MSTRAARIEELFHAALELEDDARAGFLTSSCGADAGLRREVEALLELDSDPDDRLDAAAPDVLALGDPETSLLVGRKLGTYELRRCIASGGMAAVYEAVQENPHRTVAVKVLRADVASPDLEQRFAVESSFLARLQHPNIAHVYGAEVATLDGLRVPYIAMELVSDARPITLYASEEGLSLHRKLELFVQVCDAVRHGHQRGVIHRDLKPANVLVDGDGNPKLIDFGVARAVDPDGATRRTQAGVFLGTVQYMSPEQCVDARDLDVRSDVYSLGVVLYELLCGRLPYELDDVPLPQAARIVQEHAPRRPSTVAHALRGDIETILLKTLEKDRARRYQSVGELAEDLRRFLRREPISARPPSVPYRVALYARRHKLLAGALGAILLVTLGAFVVSVSFALSEKRAREREERSSYLANIAAASASLRVFDAAGARRRLERVPAEQRGWEWAYLWGRLDLALDIHRGPQARCDDTLWVGDRVVSLWWNVGEEWQIAIYDVVTREEVARSPILADSSDDLALTADGRVVFGHQRLRVWDPETDEILELPALHGDRIRGIRSLPDGRVVTAAGDGTVRLWNVASAESRVLHEAGVAWHSLDVSPAGDRIAVGGVDGSIRVMDSAGEQILAALDAEARIVNAVAFDASGTCLASGDVDGSVRIWDLASGREERRMIGHESEIQDVAFLRGKTILASASNDGTVRIWDTDSGKTINVLYGHENWVTSVDLAPDGNRIVTGAFDGTLRIWDPFAESGSRKLTGHAHIVRDLEYTPDGTHLVSASRDGTLEVVDATTWEEVRTLPGPGGRVWSVSIDPRGELVAAGSDEPRVLVWELETGKVVRTLNDHERGVSSVVFAGNRRLLATGSWDHTVRLYEGAALDPVTMFEVDTEVISIDLTQEGDRLAVAGRSGELWLWDVASGELSWERELGTRIHSVEFSPDGQTLAVGTGEFDGTGLGVRLLATERGEELRRMIGHTEVVYGTAFTPAGDRMATASADGTVRLWDPRTGEEVLVLRGHESWVWCVDISPDGHTITSGGGNYGATGVGVRVWEAPRD